MIGSAYFDASGKKESGVLSVAGFLSPIPAWLDFERVWQQCLDDYGVSALHMKDFAHSKCEFTSWLGDDTKRKTFLGDLITVIKRHADHSFAASVRMSDYVEVDKCFRLKEWAHPYALAGAHCIGKVKSWAHKTGRDPGLINYVFENGDEGKGNLAKLSSKCMAIDPVFKPKEYSRAFQAADLLAYEQSKANQKVLSQEDGATDIGDLRAPFGLLAQISGSTEWGVVFAENIKETCVRYGVPLR